MSVTTAEMIANSTDFYDEEEELLTEDSVYEADSEDDTMEIDLDEKPDVDTKTPPGPPPSVYSPDEEMILMKLRLGNYSIEDVSKLKETLMKEGWISSEELPGGWMIKEVADNDFRILARGGELFENIFQAIEFVEKYKSYFSKEDIEKLTSLKESAETDVNDIKEEPEVEDIKEETEVDNVTKGTDSEEIKEESEEKMDDIFQLGSKVILPGGKWFQGKKAALKYLINSNYPEAQINQVIIIIIMYIFKK